MGLNRLGLLFLFVISVMVGSCSDTPTTPAGSPETGTTGDTLSLSGRLTPGERRARDYLAAMLALQVSREIRPPAELLDQTSMVVDSLYRKYLAFKRRTPSTDTWHEDREIPAFPTSVTLIFPKRPSNSELRRIEELVRTATRDLGMVTFELLENKTKSDTSAGLLAKWEGLYHPLRVAERLLPFADGIRLWARLENSIVWLRVFGMVSSDTLVTFLQAREAFCFDCFEFYWRSVTTGQRFLQVDTVWYSYGGILPRWWPEPSAEWLDEFYLAARQSEHSFFKTTDTTIYSPSDLRPD